MNKKIIILSFFLIFSAVATVSRADMPEMKAATQVINTFKPEEKRLKDMKYAFALPSATPENDDCWVVVWIRGKDKDTRIIWSSKKDIQSPSCSVYIDRAQFEQYFDYCVLTGVTIENNGKDWHAGFGGGPAGGREMYWFEWRDAVNVRPEFYCIRK